MSTATQAQTIFNFGTGDVTAQPYPHIFSEQFLEPGLYSRLKEEYPGDAFFDRRGNTGGRTGRDFYSADQDFGQWLESAPAWQEFHGFINSPAFIDFVVQAFGPHLAGAGCRVDPDRARYIEYQEGRKALERPLLSRILGAIRSKISDDESLGVNDLYVRFDIEQGGVGYGKPVHCDIVNRLVSLVLYFCDADEIEMDGGNLRIHEHLQTKPMGSYERHPREQDTRVVKTVRPKENTGVLFLCSNNSYHSVESIRSQKGYRKFIYLNVSSRAPRIW